ncbi:Sybindin-like protein [Tilletiaria anomala UBC 951]|uniref:Trafficking protein particle complex subunit n=1 Tax=Tilletiaria anomala (strain ATCC 24038 / CBS 436.72 / UBC 951) TaxID=1037660 RepID=A0A066V6T0_TILAU|nr:Sybindin-like protein [Tilletiaria anomala UBC 951]KDN35978.1 Sybindin-like protein [Tilletiaria anomala UBC 951]
MASLWIINKAGGLIYNADYSKRPTGLSSNDYLILAGTLHGIHAITAKLSPVAGLGGGKGAAARRARVDTGMQQLQANGFDMNVMATATGIKLVLITPSDYPVAPAVLLHKSYEVYADQVLKNPFYTPEMPIRVESFDKRVKDILGG